MTEFKTSHKLAAVGILLVILVAGYFAFEATFPKQKPPPPEQSASATLVSGESTRRSEQQQQQQQQQGTTTAESTTTSADNGQSRLNAAPVSASVGRAPPATASPSGDFGAPMTPIETGNAANLAPEPQAPAATLTTSAPVEAATTPTVSTQSHSQATERPPTQDASSNSNPASNPNSDLSSETKTISANKDESEEAAWREFKSNFNKSYSDFQEEQKRRAIFSSNWRFIDEFNGNQSVLFTLGINQFADLTRDEINSQFVGPTSSWQETISDLPTPIPPPMQTISTTTQDGAGYNSANAGQQSIDWRKLSGPVVDQGNCTDSAVFAAIASIESAYNSAMLLMSPNAIPIKLSERQALACLAFDRSDICKGGSSMAFVFRTLQYLAPEGLSSAQAFDQGQVMPGTCELPGGDLPRIKLSTYSIVHEQMIPEALNSVPLVVALDASQTSFHFYKSGLYHQLGCDQDSYNHHALLVGYSSGDELQEHYLLRNSWGQNWGESGHMRLLKGKQINTCVPLRMAIYPNLAG